MDIRIQWGRMPSRPDPLRIAIQVTVYVALYFATAYFFFGPILLWIGGYLTGTIATGFLAAVFANWLALRIYKDRPIRDVGLWLNRASADNLLLGLAGGVGSACLVLAPPLLVGAAHIVRTPPEQPAAGALVPFNTEVRLAVLTGLKREYDFYGNFMEPKSAATLRDQYRIRFLKCLDYFTELPILFINSDVIVDVVNLGYNTGVSPKIMGCFACGGLILFDYKEDFGRIMGDVADQVMYRDVDHLNRLVDEYLTNPHRRQDVSRHLQDRVVTEFSFGKLAKRLLVDEAAWKG